MRVRVRVDGIVRLLILCGLIAELVLAPLAQAGPPAAYAAGGVFGVERSMRQPRVSDRLPIQARPTTARAAYGRAAHRAATTTTGYVEICKKAATTSTMPVTDGFTFTVGGQTYGPLLIGSCTQPIQMPTGPTTITEAQYDRYVPTKVKATDADTFSNQLISVDLPNRTAVVTVLTGDDTTVTFFNAAAGNLQLCKNDSPAGSLAGLPFTFGVTDGPYSASYTVPVGSCSPSIELPGGQATITESTSPGISLAAVSTSPSGQLVSSNLAASTRRAG